MAVPVPPAMRLKHELNGPQLLNLSIQGKLSRRVRELGIPQEWRPLSMTCWIMLCMQDIYLARILAAASKESGAWRQALPLSSIGLHMHQNTVCIATGLGLDSVLWRPHTYQHCGSDVDWSTVHGLSCPGSERWYFCNSSLNNIVHRVLSFARIPSRLEPSGISWSDSKRWIRDLLLRIWARLTRQKVRIQS